MGIPYEFIRLMGGKKPPYIRFRDSSRSPQEQANYLLKKNHMKGHYLGACLDSSRWGSLTTVMYEMSVKGLISFIQSWMRQNQGKFQNLWHEKKISELYTKFELPYIHKESCLGENHKETILDLKGRLRCAHKGNLKFKPNFFIEYTSFDEELGMNRIHFGEDSPMDPLPGDDAYDPETGIMLPEYEEQNKEYLEKLDAFEREEPTFIVTNFCYSILSEKGTVLPLETILNRLNLRPKMDKVYCGNDRFGHCKKVKELSRLDKQYYESIGWCPGHLVPHKYTEFSFDGWDLAFYVQKWYKQLPNGDSPWFEKQS